MGDATALSLTAVVVTSLLLLLLLCGKGVVGEADALPCAIAPDPAFLDRWMHVLKYFSNISRDVQVRTYSPSGGGGGAAGRKQKSGRHSAAPRMHARSVVWAVRDERALLLRLLRWVLTGAALTCDSGDEGCLVLRREGLIVIGNFHFTMIGEMRLKNIETLLLDVIQRNIPGDFVETGVWRGGASLYARAVLNLYSQFNRTVVACDSFHGFPKVRGVALYFDNGINVPPAPLPMVKCLFAMFGLSEHVEFHQGFFEKSMPLLRKKLLAQGRRISVLRLDGDRYESTLDVLYQLYDLLSVGGYVIVDDWGWLGSEHQLIWGAKRACIHFKLMLGTYDDEPAVNIDNSGAYWQKKRQISPLPEKALLMEDVVKFKELGDSLMQKKSLVEGVHF